jgi:hypothetical protein
MTVLARPGVAAPVRVVRPVVNSLVPPVSRCRGTQGRSCAAVRLSVSQEIAMSVLALAAPVRVVRRVVDSFVPRVAVVAAVVAGRVLPRLSASWRWR